MMMATSEERMKILQMIQDKKITPEDGAKLLTALNDSSRKSKAASQYNSRTMRVRVTDNITGKTKVSVNLPLGLVDAGLNIAANFVPDIGIEELSEAIRQGMTGKIVDVVDEEDGEHVEIFIE